MCILYFALFLVNVLLSYSQSSQMVMYVVPIDIYENYTLVCNVSSPQNLTRWSYLSGSTGTSLMSYQNETCKVSSGSFLDIGGNLHYGRFLYACNSTVYQVTILSSSHINNRILACRDAVQPDGTGSTWMIKIYQGEYACSHCELKITFDVMEVNEGDNVTFVCKVSSNVTYVNWDINIGSNTATMGTQNGHCGTSMATFLDNTSKYIYTCNKTVYQVTRLNVQRSQHNDLYKCTPAYQDEGTGSNWIIKVKAPVTSVTLTPTNNQVDVIENTSIEFTCTTSTARPAATVHWYMQQNVYSYNTTQITENITTNTDYNELRVITSVLRLSPKRLHNDTKIFCTANNSVNTYPLGTNMKKVLNVIYKADNPYVPEGNTYRVTENTLGALSCSVKGGNPPPILSWNCNNISPTNQSTMNSNGNITTTFTWTAVRNQDGECKCISQQKWFENESIGVSLVVLYKAAVLSFKTNGLTGGVITVVEGTRVTFKCVTDGNPSPATSLNHGTNVLKSIISRQLEYTLSNVSCQHFGTYSCAARNELNTNTEVTYVDILVTCTPRSSEPLERKIVSGIGEKVNITCDVISYPLPVFTWWQNVNGQWKQVHNTERMLVETSSLQSTLTIYKVDTEDFTSYKVIAENSIGNMELVYSLSHNGSPDVPTHIRYFEDLSTSSSIQLAWNPGYNGGSTQIFYIKYKPKGERSWKYKTVLDDGEQTQPFDLTGLKENTYYYVVVLASNKNGNSTESQLLVANTKGIEKIQTTNFGPMVGGLVGGAIVLAVICSIVAFIIGRNMSRCMKQSNTEHKTESLKEMPHESAANIQFDNIGRDNEYEMINQGNLSSRPYSTLQPDNNLPQDDSSRDDTYENSN